MQQRSTAIIAVALLLSTFVIIAFAESAGATSRRESQQPALAHQILDAVNDFRVAHHLVPLRLSSSLAASASAHSAEMGAKGYFAHPSADGMAFWRRIRQYYGSTRYGYWSVGENLLWSSPSVTASAAMKMWIASPEHLRNLLAPAWRSIGVSAVHVLHAPGVYHGRNVTIVTTDFGVRR